MYAVTLYNNVSRFTPSKCALILIFYLILPEVSRPGRLRGAALDVRELRGTPRNPRGARHGPARRCGRHDRPLRDWRREINRGLRLSWLDPDAVLNFRRLQGARSWLFAIEVH